MPTIFFYLFSALAVAGAIALVTLKNPVSSALSMVVAFVGLAALFIGLNAYFVGIVQILVYAGAIMVLFLFIIMLLDLNADENKRRPKLSVMIGAIVLPLFFVVQVYAITEKSPNEDFQKLDFAKASAAYDMKGPKGEKGSISESLDRGQLPDTNLIGFTLFGSKFQSGQGFNFPIQIIGVLLLVSTIGVIVLSKRTHSIPNSADKK